MKRVLIVGGSGQLGTALAEVLGERAAAPSHAEFDVTTGDVDALLDAHRVDALINCAAFHQTDACERDPARAFAVNAAAVERLAAGTAARGVEFMTVSSDYVYSGTLGRAYREDDPPDPQSVYGISKVAGERCAARRGGAWYVVRTSGVFGTTGASNKGPALIERALGQAERGEPTRMVEDIVFSPSYAPHVAAAMVALIDAGAYGLHHVANAGACSWYAFVREAFAAVGLGAAPLEPVAYASFGNPTPRPAFSAFQNTTFARAGIAPLPAWQDALRAYLERRSARAEA